MSKNSKKPIHEKMISQLELPKDLMLGAAIVTITGRKEVLVENYKGIIELDHSRRHLADARWQRTFFDSEETAQTG